MTFFFTMMSWGSREMSFSSDQQTMAWASRMRTSDLVPPFFFRYATGHLIYNMGSTNEAKKGVGFIINKRLENHIEEVVGINERIEYIKLMLNAKYSLKIIQIYAPTTDHEDEEVEELYEEVSKIITEVKTQFTVVMGDFNSKLGKKKDDLETPLGPYGYGARNDRGEKLINFTLNNNLKIANTFFKKRDGRRWTWESPDGRTKIEIDFIITDKINTIKDISTMNKIDVGSDHRFLRARIELDTKLERKKMIRSVSKSINYSNLKQNRENFQLPLNRNNCTRSRKCRRTSKRTAKKCN